MPFPESWTRQLNWPKKNRSFILYNPHPHSKIDFRKGIQLSYARASSPPLAGASLLPNNNCARVREVPYGDRDDKKLMHSWYLVPRNSEWLSALEGKCPEDTRKKRKRRPVMIGRSFHTAQRDWIKNALWPRVHVVWFPNETDYRVFMDFVGRNTAYSVVISFLEEPLSYCSKAMGV